MKDAFEDSLEPVKLLLSLTYQRLKLKVTGYCSAHEHKLLHMPISIQYILCM